MGERERQVNEVCLGRMVALAYQAHLDLLLRSEPIPNSINDHGQCQWLIKLNTVDVFMLVNNKCYNNNNKSIINVNKIYFNCPYFCQLIFHFYFAG